jgi:hypothetical protein
VQLHRLAERDIVGRATKLDRKQLRKLLGRAPAQPHHLAVVKRQVEIVVVFGDHNGVVEVDHNSKNLPAPPADTLVDPRGTSIPPRHEFVRQQRALFLIAAVANDRDVRHHVLAFAT